MAIALLMGFLSTLLIGLPPRGDDHHPPTRSRSSLHVDGTLPLTC